MRLIFLIGFELCSPFFPFLDSIFVRLKVFLMTPLLFDQHVDRSRCVMQHPFCLLERSLHGVEAVWNLSTFVFDLHDPEIKLLQLDEGGEVGIQCTPTDRYHTDVRNLPYCPPRWWAH